MAMKIMSSLSGAIMGLAGSTLPTVEIAAETGAPAKTRAKPKSRFPLKTALRKMPAEKARYWERRALDAAAPTWWRKLRNVQLRAGRVKPTDPSPMTRQVRRQMERRAPKMPVGMSRKEWDSILNDAAMNSGAA